MPQFDDSIAVVSIPYRVIFHPKIKPTTLRVLAVLIAEAGSGWTCTVSQAGLARKSRLSLAQCKVHLRILLAFGLISSRHPYDDICTYTVLVASWYSEDCDYPLRTADQIKAQTLAGKPATKMLTLIGSRKTSYGGVAGKPARGTKWGIELDVPLNTPEAYRGTVERAASLAARAALQRITKAKENE